MSQNIPSVSNTSFKYYAEIAASFSAVKLGMLGLRHPIHVIQTCKQARPDCSNTQIISEIYKTHGIRGFYKSTSASILKICVAESYRGLLMIKVPETVRSYLPKHGSESSPTRTELTTACISVPIISAFDSMCICPLSRMSTLQITTKEKTNLKNIYDKFIKGNKTSLYRGYTPLFIQTSFSWGNFLIVNAAIKEKVEKHFNNIPYSGLVLTSIVGGSIQTCINAIPDGIRVRMQAAGSKKLSMRATATELVQQHGVRSLFSAVPHKLFAGIFRFASLSALMSFWKKPENEH